MEDEREKIDLNEIGEPDRVEIVPGLIFEDKLRIRTQRRLEKHFGLPISRIFPGKSKDPTTGSIEKWNGVDFTFLDNSIPLITILARQVDDDITERDIEELLDSIDDEAVLSENLEKFFYKIRPKGKLKNSQRPKNRAKKK